MSISERIQLLKLKTVIRHSIKPIYRNERRRAVRLLGFINWQSAMIEQAACLPAGV